MTELAFPKTDGDIYYGTEANSANEIVNLEAGENLTKGDVAYIKKSDGKLYKSGTGAADDIRADGIILANVNAASTGNLLQKGIYVTAGLTPMEVYYLAAAGAISTTVTGVQVGYAESATNFYVKIEQDDGGTVGTIKPWLKDHANMPANMLTAFWKECDGTAIADAESPLNGGEAPDLNGQIGVQRFLRGATTSDDGTDDTAVDNETHIHTLTVEVAALPNDFDTTGADGHYDVNATSSLPSYIEVVFIMKIK